FLHQRQADRRCGRTAAFWWGSGLGHQRQGGLEAEFGAVGERQNHQRDFLTSDGFSVSVYGGGVGGRGKRDESSGTHFPLPASRFPLLRPACCSPRPSDFDDEMSTATELQIDADQLEVTRIRALRGPNYWRLAPVIACDVRLGGLEQISSADIPGFYERLTGAIPTLAEHHCTRQEPGGFLERLKEGTHIPHILEHVALELQSLAGTDVSFGRVVPSGDPDTWWVIVAYEEEEVGLQAMRDAVKVVR